MLTFEYLEVVYCVLVSALQLSMLYLYYGHSWYPRVRSQPAVLSRIVIAVGDFEVVDRSYKRNILSLSKLIFNFPTFFYLMI